MTTTIITIPTFAFKEVPFLERKAENKIRRKAKEKRERRVGSSWDTFLMYTDSPRVLQPW
jgi:hypothetical protein